VKRTPVEQSFYYPRANAALLPNLPAELTKYKSFLVWCEAPNGNNPKYKKLPLNPFTLDGNGWNNPASWTSRAAATEVFLENSTLRGVGFVFHKCNDECFDDKRRLKHAEDHEHPFAFFDLDNVIVKGQLLPWAKEYISMAHSYTEISQTGTGVKIIVRAKLGTRAKSFKFKDSNGDPHDIEVYDNGRFFAATGNWLEGTPREIADRQELLDTLHPEIEDEEPAGPPIERATDEYSEGVDAIPDDKLLEKIRKSKKQGKKFLRLMDGDRTGYSGYFGASSALCAILAFWTRANPERIDRLYRRSKLFEKDWWEEACYKGDTSRRDYVIGKACAKAATRPMYTPPSAGLITSDNEKVVPLLANAITTLKSSPCWQGVLAFNELTLMPVKRKPAPWEPGTTPGTTMPWADHDDTKLAEWFERRGLFIKSSRLAGEAAQAVAREHTFHPVRDYLSALKWDGTDRLDTWLSEYLGTKNNDYTRAVGRCWLISGVARIYRPGSKVDYTLVLEGRQGTVKSTALDILAGDGFFLDDFADFDNKDALLKMHGAWIIEMAELSGMQGRNGIDKIKAFLTCRDDVFRAPYDRRPQHHPRGNIFAASVNRDCWLTDETGGRRFWPVKCGTIDLDKLRADRDQLWAEAVQLYKNGDKWWFATTELNDLATEEQRDRYEKGRWDDRVEEFLYNSTRNQLSIDDVRTGAIGKEVADWSQGDMNSVARCFKHNGWERIRVSVGGLRKWVYQRPVPVGPSKDPETGAAK
jgi:predicted P-loop ATPase